MADCIECGIEYDRNGPEKRRSGGLITHCPDCSEETVARHAGVMSGDGKQAGVTILSFGSTGQRDAFVTYWKAATGLHTGKNCQLGRGQPRSQKFEFKKVGEHGLGMNHKGKA